MNLLIIGAPGTGKGTMSSKIINDYDVIHISTGDMLREAINSKSDVGLLAKEYIDKGQLVPDSIIHDIICEYFNKNDLKHGFLFDGYPRNVSQAKDFDALLRKQGKKLDLVICLDMDDEALKQRITGRRVCNDCKEIYHISHKPSKVEGVCDICGGKLIQRSDDTLEALEKRLKTYYEQTEPVIEYYKEKGIVSFVDSNRDEETIYNEIKKDIEAIR